MLFNFNLLKSKYPLLKVDKTIRIKKCVFIFINFEICISRNFI